MDILNRPEKSYINMDELEVFKKYELLAKNIVECVWLFDLANNRFKYISPSITGLRGLTVEEAMKEKLRDSLTEKSLEKLNKLIEIWLPRYLDSEKNEGGLDIVDEFQQYCKDGTIKDIEISIKYMFNAETNFVDILGVSKDVTKLKKLELEFNNKIDEKDQLIKRLRDSKKELSKLIEDLLEKNKFLKVIADTDELTALNNRYYFDRRVSEEIERADRENTSLTLIIFDLDCFKSVNDVWGHDVGDQVLIKTADTARKLINKPNIIARWGGEEFAILMIDTFLDEAIYLAEELRQSIAENNYPVVGQVTASFGVAERIKSESFENWFKRADKALYFAKGEGRNCVISYNDMKISTKSLVRLEWNDQWNSGNNLIDRQHRKLFELGNRLMDLSFTSKDYSKLKDRLDRLLEHIISHFEYEDQVLKSLNYPEAKKHKESHRYIIDKSFKIRERFLRGEVKLAALFVFIIEKVIMEHLVTEDVLFFDYTKTAELI